MTPSVAMAIALIAVISPRAFGQSSADPFAAYQSSLDRQLSGILKDLDVPAPVGQTPEVAVQAVVAVAQAPDDVQAEIDMFAKQFWGGRSSDLIAALRRLQVIRPTLEGILQEEGVPTELVGVVLVESGARPLALSPRRARGLWQLIPETARQYGLEVRGGHDERIETDRATRAAARYLRDLHQQFENWPLALAAYNAGQDAVQKALRGSKTVTFWQLSSGRVLPEETRLYVPAVLAAMRLLSSSPPETPAVRFVASPIYAPVALSQMRQ